MSWEGRRVLVTGAGGFIGSHLVDELVGRSASVRAFVRYTSRSDDGFLSLVPPDVRNELDIVRGDLRDENAVAAAVQGMDTVFHLGSLIGIPYSYVHPREVVETNLTGTLNVLLAARSAGVERLVHTSTSEVYGTAVYVPIDEAHPLQGQSPYSASKIGADKLVESFRCSFGLPVITVRPFNTYGPRQSARAVIPTIITQALTSDVVKLGNLDPRRDFTFVTDLVEGFLAAADCDKALGEVVNLGSGKDVSVGELTDIIIGLVGRSVTVDSEGERRRPDDSEVQRLLASAVHARELMGWRAKVDLRTGLRSTIDWISSNLSLYEPGKYRI